MAALFQGMALGTTGHPSIAYLRCRSGFVSRKITACQARQVAGRPAWGRPWFGHLLLLLQVVDDDAVKAVLFGAVRRKALHREPYDEVQGR